MPEQSRKFEPSQPFEQSAVSSAEKALTKEEALAYLAAWRQMFAGKVGFRHFTEDLDRLTDYIQHTEDPANSKRSGDFP